MSRHDQPHRLTQGTLLFSVHSLTRTDAGDQLMHPAERIDRHLPVTALWLPNGLWLLDEQFSTFSNIGRFSALAHEGGRH